MAESDHNLIIKQQQRIQELEEQLERQRDQLRSSSIVPDLIWGRNQDFGQIKRRAESRGVDLKLPHTVLAAEIQPNTIIRKVVEQVPYPLLWRPINSLTAFIIPTGDMGVNNVKNQVEELVEIFNDNDAKSINIGIGNQPANLSDYPKSWFEAVYALKIKNSVNPDRKIIQVNDLGKYVLFLHQDPRELIEGCRLILRKLVEPDTPYSSTILNSEYLETAEKYILTGRNETKAAELLNIHVNTVKYRLDQLRSYFNIKNKHDLGWAEIEWSILAYKTAQLILETEEMSGVKSINQIKPT